jgi:hypothetical protein
MSAAPRTVAPAAFSFVQLLVRTSSNKNQLEKKLKLDKDLTLT